MTFVLIAEADTNSEQPSTLGQYRTKGRDHTIEFAALIAEVSDHNYLLRVAAPR